MAVLRVAGSGDLAGRDLQRGVEAGGAVALVVVGHPLRLAGLDRQRRLGAVQRLDLGLLIDAQHQRAFRRVEVEPDDVDHLLDQLRVVGELERADLVGLELVITPDPVHRRRRDPRRGREPAHAPVRAPVRRRLQRLREHPLNLVVVDLRADDPTAARHASPSSPRSQKFRRHNPTVGNDTPTSAAICVFDAPSAARNTIRARIACCCDADGVRSTARKLALLLLRQLDRPQPPAPRPPPYRNSLTNTRD